MLLFFFVVTEKVRGFGWCKGNTKRSLGELCVDGESLFFKAVVFECCCVV
jgi:hypothetical protein